MKVFRFQLVDVVRPYTPSTLSLHAQEAMFQATAFEVGFKFALNITRQNRALLGQVYREFQVVTFNDPVKQVVFGLVLIYKQDRTANSLQIANIIRKQFYELSGGKVSILDTFVPKLSKKGDGGIIM